MRQAWRPVFARVGWRCALAGSRIVVTWVLGRPDRSCNVPDPTDPTRADSLGVGGRAVKALLASTLRLSGFAGGVQSRNSRILWERSRRGRRSPAEHVSSTHSSTSSDEALAREAQRGERAAFAALVSRYAARVVAVVERRLGDHHAALDVAQEVWIKVFRALPRYREGASFRSWLFSIALNATRDEGRRRARRPVDELDGSAPQADPSDPSVRISIDEALQLVPEPFRSAVVLVDVEKFSYDEAAEALGCNVGTVRSRLSRGRHAFREQWDPEGTRSVPTASGANR